MSGSPARGPLAVIGIAGMLDESSTVDDFEEAMTQVRRSPREVLELLRGAIRVDELAAVTARSYLHPNGFAKIVLHDPGPTGTSVRLHVWPTVGEYPEFADVPRTDTAPHGHRWTFASTIVAGPGLLVEDFLPDDHGEEWEEFVFEPGRGPELHPRGHRRLRSSDYFIRARDEDVYWCDPDIIHMISPLDDRMTATLVLQGPEIADTAPVFRRPDSAPDPGRRPLGADTVERLVREVIRALEIPTPLDEGDLATRAESQAP